jgi:hypothetical protein
MSRNSISYATAGIAAWLGLFLCAATSLAQSVTGTITGVVTDDSGGLVAGASVTLTNERTTDARTTTTGENGGFQFVAVQPGVYAIRIEAFGFRSLERRNNLAASEHLALAQLQLTIGAVNESVTTVAEGAVVETESAVNSALLTSTQIEQISLKGRDVVNLLRLVPGVAYRLEDTYEASKIFRLVNASPRAYWLAPGYFARRNDDLTGR